MSNTPSDPPALVLFRDLQNILETFRGTGSTRDLIGLLESNSRAKILVATSEQVKEVNEAFLEERALPIHYVDTLKGLEPIPLYVANWAVVELCKMGRCAIYSLQADLMDAQDKIEKMGKELAEANAKLALIAQAVGEF